MLFLAEDDKVLTIFRYERLPDFYYVCGCLDHQELDCDKVIQSKKRGGKIQLEYDNWLKVESLGTLLSKGISFDQSSRSMKSGESVKRDISGRKSIDGKVRKPWWNLTNLR